MKKSLFVFIALLFAGVGCSSISEPAPQPVQKVVQQVQKQTDTKVKVEPLRVNFAIADQMYRFSAEVPSGWEVEHVPAIQSINIFDPSDVHETNRDKSQIFIRQFEASQFLTLNTVTIFDQEKTIRHGRDAVKYYIEKKPGVADFREQPYWRNLRHNLIDIRLTKKSPSVFYVFSYHPELDEEVFEAFIDSLEFHNDKASFVFPMDQFEKRISKKPFGLEVSPTNSPVQPERFSGFHTAVDLEVFRNEIEKPVNVVAACGGEMLSADTVNGYGGLVVQECLYGDQSIAVLYGHMNIANVQVKPGQYLQPGQQIGVLGNHESSQTSGERKHLHFGMYKRSGFDLDIRGYVPTKDQLDSWINPQDVL